MSPRRIQKRFALAIVLAAVLSVPALAEVTLTLEFTDLAPHIGQALSLRVVDTASLAEVARVVLPPIASGAFQVDVSPFTEGHTYQIDYFLDQNGNGLYDAPPIDAAWRFFISSIQGPGVVGVVHDATFTNIDWPPQSDGAIAPGEYRHTMTEPTTGISISWQNDAAVLYVGLVSPGTGWVGIGFDPSTKMQGASFFLGAVANGVLSTTNEFGVAPTFHSPDAQSTIIQTAGLEANGTTVVEFAIPLAAQDAQHKTLTPAETVTILLAYNADQDSFAARHTARSTTSITLDGGI